MGGPRFELGLPPPQGGVLDQAILSPRNFLIEIVFVYEKQK